MKDAGIFYGHLVYVTAISYILWPFGIFCGHFGVILQFWFVVPRKTLPSLLKLLLLVL
jgi:hypothetical protein